MGYSVDLRMRAVEYCLESGATCADTANIFGVGRSTAQSWRQQYEETGDLSDKPLNRKPKKIDPDALRAYVREHPDATQQEIADEFRCSNQAVSKALRRLDITRKKKTRRYKEQNPEEVEAYKETLEDFSPEKRVYADESGFNACYERECGYAPKGEKVFGEISGMKFQRTNLVAAQIGGRTVAPMCYERPTDSAIFEVWLEGRLMPELSPGDVVIMDNAQFHRKGELRKIASRYGVLVLFLPPYSPDYNPIEKLWANMKRWLKKNMRNYDSFEAAFEAAIDAYS